MSQRIHNIIVFGEKGSGKSSLVKMIVEEDAITMSACAHLQGCASRNEPYEATIDNNTFVFYDTAGLSKGRVLHWKAIEELYSLIRRLDGISLFIYCIKGATGANAMASCTLFSKVVCGEKVPSVLVVTGLEAFRDPDDWRMDASNREVLENSGIKATNIGCVVSFRGKRHRYAEIYTASQAKLRRLITTNFIPRPWSAEKEVWFSSIFRDVCSFKFCFAYRRRLAFSENTRDTIGQFIEESEMGEEEEERLVTMLLKAEKKFRKRHLSRQQSKRWQ